MYTNMYAYIWNILSEIFFLIVFDLIKTNIKNHFQRYKTNVIMNAHQ